MYHNDFDGLDKTPLILEKLIFGIKQACKLN
jgi:hypothetical protein